MKKIFTFIFCLFIAHQDVSANIGCAYLDNPDTIMATLNNLSPQYTPWYYPWRSGWNGKIDNKIYGLAAQKSIIQGAITQLEHGAQNIKTVREGNASWLLSLSNWRHHGRWFNPWSGNAAVANMEASDFISGHADQQPMTRKMLNLQTQADAWKSSKDAIQEANDQVYYNLNDYRKIYELGPQNDTDRRKLKILHVQLKAIKDPIEKALLRNQDASAYTKMNEYEKEKIFGDQERYATQYNKLWNEELAAYLDLRTHGWFTGLASTGKNLLKLLPYTETNPALAAVGYTALAAGLTYYLTKKYGKKGFAGSVSTVLLASMMANYRCNTVVPGP